MHVIIWVERGVMVKTRRAVKMSKSKREIYSTTNGQFFVAFVPGQGCEGDDILPPASTPPPHSQTLPPTIPDICLFSPQAQLLVQLFSTQKRVNCDKPDFATKQRKLRQNRFCNQKTLVTTNWCDNVTLRNHISLSQITLLCCKICFVAIYSVFPQNLVCRNLRAFVWRKI